MLLVWSSSSRKHGWPGKRSNPSSKRVLFANKACLDCRWLKIQYKMENIDGSCDLNQSVQLYTQVTLKHLFVQTKIDLWIWNQKCVTYTILFSLVFATCVCGCLTEKLQKGEWWWFVEVNDGIYASIFPRFSRFPCRERKGNPQNLDLKEFCGSGLSFQMYQKYCRWV